MPLFLFWYILRDLLKILVISTIVLVTVISFGAAIKPISDGALGPMDLLKYILLAIPPMLQFALPFSATFSATLVYHRMSSDNEITACAVSGVPYTQMLLPAATLGVVLTILLSFFANYISPGFWREMERTAHLDAPEYFLRAVKQGIPVKAGNTLIYAHQARKLEPEPGNDAYASLWLKGVLIVKLQDGVPNVETTARQGMFNLYRRNNMTIISGVLEDGLLEDQLTPGGSRVTYLAERCEPIPLAISDDFRTKTKFMSLTQLKQMAETPELYWRVATQVDKFRQWLVGRLLINEINQQLDNYGRIELIPQAFSAEGAESNQRWVLYGKSIQQQSYGTWNLIPSHERGNCRLIMFEQGRATTEFKSAQAALNIKIDPLVEPTIFVTLHNVTQTDLTDPSALVYTREDVPLLSPTRYLQPIRALYDKNDKPDQIAAELNTRSVQELVLLVPAHDKNEANQFVQKIDVEIDRLRGMILSRLHERTAMSLSCLIMMLLGGVLALHMRSSLPLTVFLWSFIPSLASVLLIASGSDIVKNINVQYIWGLCILWSGNLGMSILVLGILKRIIKN